MTIDQTAHIAFGADAAFYRGAAVALTSIAENNRERPIIFHVFTMDCTSENRERLNQLALSIGKEIQVHLPDYKTLGVFERYHGLSHYPPSILIRLLVPEILASVTDKVLYLDADLLCFGDISELLTIDFEDHIAAVVADSPQTVKERLETLGIRNGNYFNSGVIYIDIRKWISAGITDAVLKEVASRYLEFPDQDALNIVLDGRVKYLDKRWNFLYNSFEHLKKREVKMKLPSPYVIVHFIGQVKPWYTSCLNEWQQYFLEVQSRTPWAATPLDRPKKRKEIKQCYKIMFHLGRFRAGVYWYIKYTLQKFGIQG